MKKTILITGTGTPHGFGFGTAMGLAKNHHIIATVRTNDEKAYVEMTARQLQLDMVVLKLDITNEEDLEQLNQYSIDILVNNAGIGQTGPAIDQPFDQFKETFETNVFGTFKITQKVLRKMISENKQGKIVFVSSNAGLQGLPNLSSYAGSKHAIEALAASLKKEMKKYHIKICVINPGPYSTGFNEQIMETAQKWYKESESFVDPADYHYYDDILKNKQADPKEMIDEMIRIIPLNHHHYRTFLPSGLAEEVQAEQRESWNEVI